MNYADRIRAKLRAALRSVEDESIGALDAPTVLSDRETENVSGGRRSTRRDVASRAF